MKKCRITVLKTTFQEDLAKEYGIPGLGRCPAHKEGEVFETYCDKPDGFCTEAWRAIGHYVFALTHGAGRIFGDWIDGEGIAINSCNDGLRPVIFKIEVLEGEDMWFSPPAPETSGP